jgi:HTH-type transcriptional regulator / antitoxin HigA
MAKSNEFAPDWSSPPGETVADILDERSLPPKEFAKQMGYTPERAQSLLSGDEAITAETATRLELVLGVPAAFWIVRESQYREGLSRFSGNPSPLLESAWLKDLPVKEMMKFGWIKEPTSASCLRFFDVPDQNAWYVAYGSLLEKTAFRTSPTFKSQLGAVAAWLRQAEIESASIKCRPWDLEQFRRILVSIRALTREKEPNRFISELTSRCAKCGVALVIVRSPTGCRASGATRFLSSDRALLQLSFRYLSDDQFWFTFFHEAAHLILHDKSEVFLESNDFAPSKEENEANKFAAQVLIPPKFYTALLNLPVDGRKVVRFAKKLGVSPGIVVGQLQHDGRFTQRQLNNLKRRFTWNE